MVIDENKRPPGLISVGIETLNGVPGFISLWAMIALLAIIVVTGFIFYRFFVTDNKVQLALDDSIATVSEPIRYKISPQLQSIDDKSMVTQPTEGTPPILPHVADDNHASVDAEQHHTPVLAESNPETVDSRTIDPAPSPSGDGKDDAFMPDTPSDSQPNQPESAIYKDRTPPHPQDAEPVLQDAELIPQGTESIKGPETLYLKVPVGRVRKAPLMDAEILFYLNKGDRVSVIDTRDGWYWIDTMDGRKGWAHGMLFSMDAPHRQMGVDNNLIRAVLVETPAPDRRTVHIVLSDYHLPRTMVLEGERPRVVCDFYGLHLASGMKKVVEYGTGLVRGVRFGIHAGDNPKIRIVVDLVPEHDYIVEQRFILEENVYLLDIRLK